MLCEDATYDDHGYLEIKRGGLSVLHTLNFPVALEVDLAFRATRTVIDARADIRFRIQLVNEDGARVAEFALEAPALADDTLDYLAGRNLELPLAFVFRLEKFKIADEGEYRIDVYANESHVGEVPLRVVAFPNILGAPMPDFPNWV